MATLYLRSIPPAIHERLKERAKRNRRSLTQEAIAILEEALGMTPASPPGWAEMERLRDHLRARYGPFKDSALLLREDRRR